MRNFSDSPWYIWRFWNAAMKLALAVMSPKAPKKKQEDNLHAG
jgi:hypothetical protein